VIGNVQLRGLGAEQGCAAIGDCRGRNGRKPRIEASNTQRFQRPSQPGIGRHRVGGIVTLGSLAAGPLQMKAPPCAAVGLCHTPPFRMRRDPFIARQRSGPAQGTVEPLHLDPFTHCGGLAVEPALAGRRTRSR